MMLTIIQTEEQPGNYKKTLETMQKYLEKKYQRYCGVPTVWEREKSNFKEIERNSKETQTTYLTCFFWKVIIVISVTST